MLWHGMPKAMRRDELENDNEKDYRKKKARDGGAANKQQHPKQ